MPSLLTSPTERGRVKLGQGKELGAVNKKLISEPHGTRANVLKRHVASQVNSFEAGNDTPSSILQLWEFLSDSGDCVAYGPIC